GPGERRLGPGEVPQPVRRSTQPVGQVPQPVGWVLPPRWPPCPRSSCSTSPPTPPPAAPPFAFETRSATPSSKPPPPKRRPGLTAHAGYDAGTTLAWPKRASARRAAGSGYDAEAGDTAPASGGCCVTGPEDASEPRPSGSGPCPLPDGRGSECVCWP